jgi:protein phosphatase 2C family protein 2/3
MITAEPDITITKVDPTDKFIVMGCDGIWDCLTSQQAVSLSAESNLFLYNTVFCAV